ncbi:hypothetical protein CHS0354_012904 [Potamilus streckersoni]|uniref:Uncharacterized protein n=1 Tax=Potamilus streckersoni TaxID=2493646 RepID=A0AAE0TBB0_9BIVA|nr:hypothetical protein CHS0354_012904 [Potamilus streckersoni]
MKLALDDDCNFCRKGSLIVDYNIILNRHEEVITDLTKASSDLASGQTVLIGGINSTAKEVSVGDVKIPIGVNVDQQMCISYVAVNGGCQDSFVCVVENGKPRCK